MIAIETNILLRYLLQNDGKQADFPVVLIVNKAKRIGQLSNNEVTSVFTFDKAALEIDFTERP